MFEFVPGSQNLKMGSSLGEVKQHWPQPNQRTRKDTMDPRTHQENANYIVHLLFPRHLSHAAFTPDDSSIASMKLHAPPS